MKYYKIEDTATGNFIDEFDTLQEAKNMLANYETQDKQEDIYVDNFYKIVQQKMIVRRNEKKMFFTILLDGQSYIIQAFSRSAFQRLEYNTENDWSNYINAH